MMKQMLALKTAYRSQIVLAAKLDAEVGALAREMGVSITHTYVLRAHGSSLVKIGKSRKVHERLQTLRLWSPTKLRLMRVIPFDCERRMHDRFARLRRHGEWFEFDLDMLVETFHEDIVGQARALLEAA